MCHLILLLPIVALPVFWMLPPTLSVPIYSVVVLVSGWVYWYAVKAMRLPLVSEDVQLTRAVGTVVGRQSHRLWRIEILGECWLADSPERLQEGDQVKITGRDGLTLHVRKLSSEGAGRTGGPLPGRAG
jgi:membrane protein implicated in regulation of membrane protease activity